jgi:5-methylcytosine-specific restriction endonuclease McrA
MASVHIPLGPDHFATIDQEDYDLVAGFNWSLLRSRRTFYAVTQPYDKVLKKNTSVGMHRLIMGEPPEMQVDHADGNGLNNTRANLRIATRSQNQANKPTGSTNTSGYKGISLARDTGKWCAQITHHRKRIYLGLFADKESAARAYDRAAIRIFGEFAYVNFPAEVLHVDYRESAHWLEVSSQALANAEGRCQVCYGVSDLDVRHRTRIRLGCELPGDLVVLCEDCRTKLYGKSLIGATV